MSRKKSRSTFVKRLRRGNTQNVIFLENLSSLNVIQSFYNFGRFRSFAVVAAF
jgi:hypothetical protein